MLLIDIKRLDMGPANLKWVQYYFLVKCVGFEPFYKVGPAFSQFIYVNLNIKFSLGFYDYEQIEESNHLNENEKQAKRISYPEKYWIKDLRVGEIDSPVDKLNVK